MYSVVFISSIFIYYYFISERQREEDTGLTLTVEDKVNNSIISSVSSLTYCKSNANHGLNRTGSEPPITKGYMPRISDEFFTGQPEGN